MHPAAPPPDQASAAPGLPAAGPFFALVAAVGSVAAALVLWLVPQFEGTVLQGYRDLGGVVTACTGNTSAAMLGMAYTPERCRELLASDLVRHNAGLNGCVTAPLQDHERAALLSWAFNVGVGNACSSTLVAKANAGDMPGACAELSRWTYVAGRNCAAPENALRCGGIPRRRAAERAMCEGRYTGAAAAAASRAGA
jgi:lysozyme